MEFVTPELIGFVAGSITLGAHIPQIIKSKRSKKTHDISLPLYAVLWVAMALWIIYGYVNDALAVFVMNSIAICLVSYMIYLKLKYGMIKPLPMTYDHGMDGKRL